VPWIMGAMKGSVELTKWSLQQDFDLKSMFIGGNTKSKLIRADCIQIFLTDSRIRGRTDWRRVLRDINLSCFERDDIDTLRVLFERGEMLPLNESLFIAIRGQKFTVVRFLLRLEKDCALGYGCSALIDAVRSYKEYQKNPYEQTSEMVKVILESTNGWGNTQDFAVMKLLGRESNGEKLFDSLFIYGCANDDSVTAKILLETGLVDVMNPMVFERAAKNFDEQTCLLVLDLIEGHLRQDFENTASTLSPKYVFSPLALTSSARVSSQVFLRVAETFPSDLSTYAFDILENAVAGGQEGIVKMMLTYDNIPDKCIAASTPL
ncbi:hypothetical protein HDU76_004075, partial [Blyttiomyces sp. JEL0837]